MKDYEVYGLSGFSPQYGPCILLNVVNTVERRIFSLAHEYGHLLMHRSFYRSKEPASGLPKDHELEQMANVFAANFLVPDIALKAAFQRSVGAKPVGIEDVVFLKRYFKVSAEMMIRRLKDEVLVDASIADGLMTEVNRRRPDLTQEIAPLQTDLFGEWKRLNRFDHLARKAALDNLVSVGNWRNCLASISSKRESESRSGAGMCPPHKLHTGSVSLDSTIILDSYLIGRVDLFLDLFAQRMLVSDFVSRELMQAAIELPGAETISLATDEEWQFFQQVRRRRPGLGLGEVGAITVARYHRATLITNDMQARQTAEELELPVSGSIGVLECAVELGIISGQEAVGLLQAMIREGAGFLTNCWNCFDRPGK